VCGGFAAERSAGRTHRSTAAGAATKQQRHRSTAFSSKCGQCHVDSRVDEAEHILVFVQKQQQKLQFILQYFSRAPNVIAAH